jgi:predicted dehydrogenase
MNLSPEERAIGRENFHSAIGSEHTRRDFLLGSVAAVAGTGAGLGSFYFGYGRSLGEPVRIGVIGTGDEGSVLIGAHTPDYVQIKAICDIRPYNIHRAFHGDASSETAMAARPGLMKKYGWSSEDEARKHVKVYTDYKDLLNDPEIEGVVIALPLHLHAPVAIEAMSNADTKLRKHVLTEKLMAKTVGLCKDMGRVSSQTGMLLATGHQRHYSILYDNAVHAIKQGLLGDIHHIRAQWHRGNLPNKDSWSQPLPDDKMAEDVKALEARLAKEKGAKIDEISKRITLLKLQLLDRDVDAAKYGYIERKLEDGTLLHTPLCELIRWRLWDRTGGGLMAELGSHQLDAAGIFVSAQRKDGKKARPLSVSGMGGRHIFPLDRDCDDHVYCMYEFPAADYEKDTNRKVVVSYSSINGNGFGDYGECVMGTDGTLILLREQEVMLFKGAATSTSVTVSKGAGGPTLDTSASGGGAAAEVGRRALDRGPVSRGYTEEIEHWAWCIRNPSPENQPRCQPEVAMADAIIALTSNLAMRERKQIEFKQEWFEIDHDDTPEGIKPTVPV